MSKAGTKFQESEREINPEKLSRFGINPFSLHRVLEDYAKNCHPLPVKYVLETPKDKIMDQAAASKNLVELYLKTPGYLGSKVGDVRKIDKLHLKFLAHSYYTNLRPLPVSFIYFGVEVHLRTPGIQEENSKNPLRQFFDPTK